MEHLPRSTRQELLKPTTPPGMPGDSGTGGTTGDSNRGGEEETEDEEDDETGVKIKDFAIDDDIIKEYLIYEA